MTNTMKHSGIPWIGDIPSHWEVELIGNHIKEVDCPNSANKEGNALQFKMGTIIPKKGGDSKYNPETLESYNIVEKGDIIINGLNLSFDFISQRVGLVKEKGVITSAYLAVRPDKAINSEYLTYLFKAYDNCKAFHGMGKGLRQTLAYKEFKTNLIFVPPLSEQKAIADYLDKHCAEVDEMVSLQEKIIEELRAYRQAIITETVTHGLNPNAPMKDSGVEWIGQIPEGWEVKRLKNLCHIETGNQDTQDSISDGRYPFYVRSPHVERSNSYSAEGEGILMAGDGAGAGRVFHHAYGKYAVHQRVYRLYDFFELNSNYLFYYISSLFEKIMDMGSAQSTVPSVRLPMLTNFLVCIPKNAEQQAIADYLDKKTAEIDQLITIKQRKIEELKEYKKSLIYEYVTGKKQI